MAIRTGNHQTDVEARLGVEARAEAVHCVDVS